MNVVDALMITAGLDASSFLKGMKDVDTALDKTKDKAAKSGKDVEKSAAGMTETLGKTSTAFLELMGLFMGGVGFKQFIKDAVEANNAVGRLATGLGTSGDMISAWGIAAARMGGNAATTQASLQGLSDSLVDLRLQGKQLPLAFGQLSAIKSIDISSGWEKAVSGLAEAASIMAKTDPAGANRLLRQLGLDPATVALMIEQGPRMAAYLEMQKKFAPSDADRAAAVEMTRSRAGLAAATDLLAAKVMTALAPALEFLAGKLEGAIMAIAAFVEKNPGLVKGIGLVVAVLSGSAAISAIKTILSLSSALLGLTRIGIGSGLLALLSRVGLAGLIAGGYDTYEHSSAGAGEDERKRHEQYDGGGKGALRKKMGEANGGAGGKAVDGEGGPGRSPARGGWWTPERQRHAYEVLRANGVSERGAIALISRWKNVESTNAGPNALNPHSGAFGIEQGLGSRKPHTNDFDAQLRAAAAETKNGEGGGSGLIFDRARDDREAARGASVHERAEGWNGRTDNFQGATLSGMDEVRRNVKGTEAPKPGPDQGDADWRAHRGGIPPMPKNMPQHDSWLWKGLPGAGGSTGSQLAALNNIANTNSATTTSSSNESHIHGGVHIHVASGSDATAIAGHIDKAITDGLMRTDSRHADYGIA